MSNFYARYVPPGQKSEAVAVTSPSPNSTKRKREGDTGTKQKQGKKPKLSTAVDKVASKATRSPSPDHRTPADDASVAAERAVLDKYRVTEAARSADPSADIRPRRSKIQVSEEVAQQNHDHDDGSKSRKGHKSKLDVDETDSETEAGTHHKRHAAVLSKFEKAKQLEAERPQDSEASSDQPPIELHGLEPLPQPQEVEVVPSKPTYSTLPGWQETPLNVSPELTATFESLGVSSELLANLHRSGLDRAFPVQAAILPLLLEGPDRYDGDLCISAATGSGKTLAYVLPTIDGLRSLAGTKLRAVIVVPTRELVKQVRELCEICASGTSLKIATAVGSKSIKEEQESLVAEEHVYNPQQYKIEQKKCVDWSSISLEKLVHKSTSGDPMDSVGYVTRYRSKVDILITTPGRLVDHLNSTPGFTLDDVKWLVVDEADKLLNQSYQEWIEVVVPALQSRAATKDRDDLLRHMRLAPPRRKVTKVLLSATMTRDVSKLNALGLYNPKMVVLTGASTADASASGPTVASGLGIEFSSHEISDVFHIPELLDEAAIAVPDGSEKPLYLLQLLDKHIGIIPSTPSVPAASTSASVSDTSSDADTSSESSSDSDSLSSDEEDSSSSDSATTSDHSSTAQATPSKASASRQTNEAGQSPRALIFARSTASATRLSRLLVLLCPALASRISTLTRSTTSSASSRRALALFRSSKISILIATDRASRGLDVPGLEHVISYDVPSSALTYVHRVGRSARAGKAGHAWTFVEHREGAWFWREIGGKGKGDTTGPGGNDGSIERIHAIRRIHLSIGQEDIKARYEKALQQLGDEARNTSS
ncbi:hypothetical protein A1O3_04192 [Capronia epimyces CBS 606.96]|uniref:ATP-dependent RNA helicase n=1 Tax=Capronia epimyces CBS 606.96 TaxID=1182542 RepID=W9Y3Y8_9EURO|nr:uncharacterized protein A1O3_04192 [Capronia epimyces CBS 606.96]EXJ87233.1 hypothetical protein A1O3_04192 [Capronia epimyces CBS 606.96]